MNCTSILTQDCLHFRVVWITKKFPSLYEKIFKKMESMVPEFVAQQETTASWLAFSVYSSPLFEVRVLPARFYKDEISKVI